MSSGAISGTGGCYSCGQNAALTELPPRDLILLGDGWRVAHAIRTALPGWLVLVSRRHVTSIAELDATEAAEFGLLTHLVSRALIDVTGCAKTYVAAFSEAAGFTHLHAHVIPRAFDLPAAEHGPAVFTYLRRPPSEWVSTAVMDDIAQALSARLAGGLPAPAHGDP